MTRPFKPFPLLLLALLIGALLLAGCGGGDEATPTPMPSPTPLPAVEAPAAAAAPAAQEPTATPAGGQSPLQPESPLGAPDSPMPTPTPTPAPPDLEIEAGKSAVVGHVISLVTGQPIPNAIIRLPEVYCPEDVKPEEKETRCFWALDDAFSPSTFSDDDGYFEFLNVAAQDYVLFVGDIAGNHGIAVHGDDKPNIYTAPADQGVNLGTVPVEYP